MSDEEYDNDFETLECVVVNNIKEKDVYADLDDVMDELKKMNIDAKAVTLAHIDEAIEKHSRGCVNRCVTCGVDMGLCNPRQLCGKTWCDAYIPE